MWKVIVAVVATAVGWIKECEVEGSAAEWIMEKRKYESGTVVLSNSGSHVAVTADSVMKSV